MATLEDPHVKEITVDLYRAEYSGFYLEVPRVRLRVTLTNDHIHRWKQKTGWRVDGVEVLAGHDLMPLRLREGRTRFYQVLKDAIERELGKPLAQPITAKVFAL